MFTRQSLMKLLHIFVNLCFKDHFSFYFIDENMANIRRKFIYLNKFLISILIKLKVILGINRIDF
jgi:hypothetical protein